MVHSKKHIISEPREKWVGWCLFWSPSLEFAYIICYNIDNDVITAIAKQNPLYAVFKDKSFATDSVGINNEQLFKTYSPSTVVKVI